MLVSSFLLVAVHLTQPCPGQDVITEKIRDEYNREAAKVFNDGERVASENGQSGTMLAIITRGSCVCDCLLLGYSRWDQAFSN